MEGKMTQRKDQTNFYTIFRFVFMAIQRLDCFLWEWSMPWRGVWEFLVSCLFSATLWHPDSPFIYFYFYFLWHWDLNSELCVCWAGILPLNLQQPPFIFSILFLLQDPKFFFKAQSCVDGGDHYCDLRCNHGSLQVPGTKEKAEVRIFTSSEERL
jgi:hypothetical protein